MPLRSRDLCLPRGFPRAQSPNTQVSAVELGPRRVAPRETANPPPPPSLSHSRTGPQSPPTPQRSSPNHPIRAGKKDGGKEGRDREGRREPREKRGQNLPEKTGGGKKARAGRTGADTPAPQPPYRDCPRRACATGPPPESTSEIPYLLTSRDR